MPHIQAFMLKRKYGSLEQWHETLEREDSLPTNSLLHANNDFWGNTSAANYKHEIAADDIVFTSNDVIKIDNNLYIIGCYGVTDWCMILGLYSRGGQFQKYTTTFQDEVYNWNFFTYAQDAEETKFPFKKNREMYTNSLNYTNAVLLSAPRKIKGDNSFTLVYRSGEDFKEAKQITICVQSEAWQSSVVPKGIGK